MIRIAPKGANSFLSDLIRIQKGGKNENGRVASPESVPIHLKMHDYTTKGNQSGLKASPSLLQTVNS